jgi:hypothetical protein
VKIFASLLVGVLLAACAAPGSVPPANAPLEGGATAPLVQACPAAGSVQRSGKASAKVTSATVKAGGKPIDVTWVVTFAKLTMAQLKSRPVFIAKLHACGASKTPVGKFGGKTERHQTSSCSNGVCSATDTYVRQFDPPKSVTATFKYDLIDFHPRVPQPPYTFLKGALIQVSK